MASLSAAWEFELPEVFEVFFSFLFFKKMNKLCL